MLKHRTCPVCGEISQRQTLRDRTWFCGFEGKGILCSCGLCAAVFLDEYDVSELQAYENEYFASYDVFQSETVQNAFRRGEFRRRLQWLARRTPGREVLDIGCGNGDFLIIAKREGWSPCGVDITTYAKERVEREGIALHVGDAVEYLRANPRSFDAIHMNHSLEHMMLPADVLAAVHGALRSEGMLYAEVPNEFDNLFNCLMEVVGRRRKQGALLGRSIPSPTPSPHLIFFNRRSLDRIAARAGFRRRRVDARHRSDLRIRSLVPAIHLFGVLINRGPFLTLSAYRD